MSQTRPRSRVSRNRTSERRTDLDDKKSLSPFIEWAALARAIAVPYLLELWSQVIELNLSPVYGSIPASIWSKEISTYVWPCLVVLAFMTLSLTFPDTRLLKAIRGWLPVVAWASVCALHAFLYRLSSLLGPMYGILATRAIVQLPVSFIAACTVVYPFHRNYAVLLGALLVCTPRLFGMQSALDDLHSMIGRIGNNVLVSRVGLLTGVTAAWSVVSLPFTKSALLRAAISAAGAIIYLLVLNPHGPFEMNLHLANHQLRDSEFVLIERLESNTGYISVVENRQLGYRALRCDHSLLGGNWLVTEDSIKQGMTQPESIFSVFTTLEAVRLMGPSEGGASPSKPSALVVGLGIGTAPAALARHGVETVAVELDQAVTRMARKYFDLPENVTVNNEDAHAFVTLSPANQYDYIIHDVFTGGAEPIELFTLEFLTSLKRILKPTGYVAINYAGDLQRKSTWRVLRTIDHVFENCRAFRDSEPAGSVGEDFANFIVFCSRHKAPWAFRKPVEADYLGSLQRREWLLPQYEVSLKIDATAGLLSSHDEESQQELAQYHHRSAADHWRIMRKVMPDMVWETW